MKILVISPEGGTAVRRSSLSETVNDLTDAYTQLGVEARVYSPFYPRRMEGGLDLETSFHGKEEVLEQNYAIYTEASGFYHYVGHEDYFDRSKIYHENGRAFDDNHFRFAFLASAALHHCRAENFIPDRIHFHEWGAAFVPVYARGQYGDVFQGVPLQLTLHNASYDFYMPASDIGRLGLDRGDFSLDGYEFWGKVSLLKVAILYADQVVLTSEGYRDRLFSMDLPGGIQGFLERHSQKLIGIQSGLNYGQWGPSSFSETKLPLTKRTWKKDFCKKMEISNSQDFFVFSYLGGESGRVGEVLSTILSNVMSMDIHLIIGLEKDHELEGLFQDVAQKHPQKLSVHGINEREDILTLLSAADAMFIAEPSEPSASIILKTLAWGAIPICGSTHCCGADLVKSFDGTNQQFASGFGTESSYPDEMLRILRYAWEVYSEYPDIWGKLVQNAFKLKVDWVHTARKYLEELV